MSHAATGIRTVPVLARRDGTYVWSYRANALTEMSEANRGAWRTAMRRGKERANALTEMSLGTSVHGGQRCAGEGRANALTEMSLGTSVHGGKIKKGKQNAY